MKTKLFPTRPAKIAYTLPEAVQMTGISRTFFYKLFQEGKIRPRKSGRRTLILTEDLDRFISGLPEAY